MRWEDERYIRSYTTDDGDYVVWPWESRALWWPLLRRCSRVGVVKVGRHGARALAEMVRLPVEVVEVGLQGLLDDGCVTWASDGVLFVRNFMQAQEAAQSDAARKRAERERARDLLAAQVDGVLPHREVTKRDSGSQDVTESHDLSGQVTGGHAASRSVTPCCAEPSRAVPTPDTAGRAAPGGFSEGIEGGSAGDRPEPAGGEGTALELFAQADPRSASAPAVAEKRARRRLAGEDVSSPKSPLPFTLAQATAALKEGGGVVVEPFPQRLAARLTTLIRENPHLDDWRAVSEWYAAGGDGYGPGFRRKKADLALIATANTLTTSIGHARDWIGRSRPPLVSGGSAPRVGPAPIRDVRYGRGPIAGGNR